MLSRQILPRQFTRTHSSLQSNIGLDYHLMFHKSLLSIPVHQQARQSTSLYRINIQKMVYLDEYLEQLISSDINFDITKRTSFFLGNFGPQNILMKGNSTFLHISDKL
ncbi:hypothetical protein NPIL_133911 [Nephila pilipes]|uniref:Uncharacterized protein n=1 Tax=Nephila pilipes TaxID=299642 RepID=A0A8X6TNJ1_NEPPI|nr:hypothetical protein NPIL_133911 [Nephila pilipes]